MKHLTLIISLLLVSFFGFSQIDTTSTTLTYKDGRVVFENIKNTPAISKSTLFGFAKKWITESFQNPENVIISIDEPTGQIIGKGTTSIITASYHKEKLRSDGYMELSFNFQIDCKEDKYRFRFYNIISTGSLIKGSGSREMSLEDFDKIQSTGKHKEIWSRLLKNTNIHFFNLLKGFDDTIIKSKSDEF